MHSRCDRPENSAEAHINTARSATLELADENASEDEFPLGPLDSSIDIGLPQGNKYAI